MNDRAPVVVLDASAILAWLQQEPGANRVEESLAHGECLLSAVNYAEVIAKLVDKKIASYSQLPHLLAASGVRIVPFDDGLAMQSGITRSTTRQAGLSLGDRACLALAIRENAEVLTTDQIWLSLVLSVKVTNIRNPG